MGRGRTAAIHFRATSAPPAHDANDTRLLALRALPFATYAVLDADSVTLRRGSRARTPSVRLRPLGDAQLPPMEQLGNPYNSHLGTLAPVEPPPPPASPSKTLPPPSNTRSSDLRDDLGEVLSAGGEVPRSSEAHQVMETPAIHRAVRVLTNPATLALRQQDDTHLGPVHKSLCDSGAGEGGVDTTSYGLDDEEVVRYTDEQGRKLPAIPESMISDVLALVHTLHGHAGVGSTLALVRDHFHWPTVTRDTRQYVLSCGCRRRKRPNSRRIVLLLGRPLKPWDELQMDILKIDTPSLSGNKYVLLVVDRASKFPFGFPLETKQAVGVARVLTELCLTFGVPRVIRCDAGEEFGAEVVTHLCRWLHADIVFGPSDHPRGQGAVERLGGWLQELLAELCRSWPERWDEYVSPAIWIKSTLPDVALPSNMTPCELLFGREPRTSLDSLVHLSAETEQSGVLNNFVERRKHDLREVRLALEKQHKLRVTARARANASISRPSAGVALEKGSLVLVRESESSKHRDNRGRKLQDDLYTGPWRVTEVLQTGLSMQVTMHGRKQRTRNVSTADVKPYYLRPLSLRH